MSDESNRDAPPDAVKQYMAEIGRRGGKAKGIVKRRPSDHYKKAALKRWSKAKPK